MEDLDFYKYELNKKTVRKAASRLAFQPVKFKIAGTAIVVLATRENRNIITNITANLSAHTVKASVEDIVSLVNKYGGLHNVKRKNVSI